MWTAIQEAIFQITGTSVGSMSFWERILYLIAEYGPSYIDGAKNTLIIAVISTLVGCVIGFAVGIVQTIPVTNRDSAAKRFLVKLCKILLSAYVELFRGTPMMIQAVFIYYGVPMVFGYHMDTLPAAFLIVSINTGAYMAETVRGGILSIDPGQTEGAKAIGMTHVQTMISVILPQTLRNILPQIGNNLIINIKDTCVLSAISVVELFFTHKGVAGATYTYFESATITMAIYLVMTLVFAKLLRWVEKKMDGDDSYDLATTDTLAHTSGMYRYRDKEEERAKEAARQAKARKTAGVSDIGNLNLDQNERGR